jgi:hypothetical protein
MLVFQFNHKYLGNNIAIVNVRKCKFIIKASSQDEWDEIVERFESLTDVLRNKKLVLLELKKWSAVKPLRNMGLKLIKMI